MLDSLVFISLSSLLCYFSVLCLPTMLMSGSRGKTATAVSMKWIKLYHCPLDGFFIQNTLNLLNIGVGIKRWVSVYFLLSRGVSQGCPPSPHLYILGVEILACIIPQDKEIQGIKDFNSEAEISQFADDKSLLWSSYDSAKKVNEMVDSFGNASDPKTETIWV